MEALPPVERREVEALAALHPEIQQEIERTQVVVNQYALLHATEPRADLRQEILGKVQIKPEPGSTPTSTLKPYCWGWIGFLVALVFIIIAIIFYIRSENSEKQVAKVVAENQNLQENYNRVVQNFEFINNPATKIIALGPPPPPDLPIAPDAEVTVYWNPEEGSTLLAIKNLPKPPAGKQYQLWTIKGTQAAKPAGLIDYNALDFQAMDTITDTDVFAITLENEGGSNVPTSKIYAVGKAS